MNFSLFNDPARQNQAIGQYQARLMGKSTVSDLSRLLWRRSWSLDGHLWPFASTQSNPADFPHRIHQNLFQLFTHRKPVATDLDGANNIHPTWMPLTGRFPVH
jgi:hypothetical protein